MARKTLHREDFAQHETRAAKVRKHCLSFIKKHVKNNNVYSLLSGGVDSHVCLFAALEAGLEPKILSFTLKDRESRDFRTARATARHFGLRFIPIILDHNVAELKRHVWELNHKYLTEFSVKKSTVECTWPMYHAMNTMEPKAYFLCGFGGDPPFASTRKAKKLYYEGQDKLDAETKGYYTSLHNDLQLQFIKKYSDTHKKLLRPIMPLNDLAMYDIFHGMDPFKDGNKPIQKAPLRLAFWEYFEQIQVYTQQSFQKGDTGISECFEQLIYSDWNTKGYKSVIGIYNDVERKEIKWKKS